MHLGMVVALAGAMLGGCGLADDGKPLRPAGDDAFTCAALISAADRLMASGALPKNFMTEEEALQLATGHLNAWAVLNSSSEADAFAAVQKERDRIVTRTPPIEIGRRARACLSGVA